MIENYIIGSICIVVSLLFPLFYYYLIKKSVKLDAEIVEKIQYDNLFGQKYTWIILINDNGDVRRLYNTIYKTKKEEPLVGDKIVISKVSVFGNSRYISKFQIGAGTLLMATQFIMLWVIAFIAFGIIT